MIPRTLINSLQGRLVIGASVVLAAFLGVTGLALERAYHRTGVELVRETLLAHVYALLAAAESADGGQLVVPDALTQPRFAVPESGLYAQIITDEGHAVWRSQSLLERSLRLPTPANAGVELFATASINGRDDAFALGYRVLWEQSDASSRAYIFQVADDRREFDRRLAHFRRNLWGWLIAAGAILLGSQYVLLTWNLWPLRRIGEQLRAIERGEREHLDTQLPVELAGLASRMNQLIDAGRSRIERQRNAFADLAHALKTPLAVLKASAETSEQTPASLRQQIDQSVQDLDRSIAYHLSRASAAGHSPLMTHSEVVSLTRRLCESMRKVHHQRGVVIELRAPSAVHVRADDGDLMEVIGNLLDNACKWARHQVRITLAMGTSAGAQQLVIRVEDDGCGIAVRDRERVLARGERADQRGPALAREGQGIGLAVVCDLVEGVYHGELKIGDSELGGACIEALLVTATSRSAPA